MKTLEQLKAEAAQRGIVEGARIECACDGTIGIVIHPDGWSFGSIGDDEWLMVGEDERGWGLYAKDDDRWAEVLTPAPSKEEGLKEGDAVECGPAMRAAIVELAKELGLIVWGEDPITMSVICWCDGRINHVSKVPLEHDGTLFVGITPEAFIAKMRVTAKLPKPEPPIMIGSNKVRFNIGSIKVGCTTIDNAKVRAIAEKLID